MYRAFGSLVRRGYVRSWTVVPGGRRGARARKYYELTPRGIAVAERQRAAIAHLLGFPVPLHSTVEAARMGARLRRVAEVSALTFKLQLGGPTRVGPAVMTSHSLEDVAIRVATALGEEDCVLVGGLGSGGARIRARHH